MMLQEIVAVLCVYLSLADYAAASPAFNNRSVHDNKETLYLRAAPRDCGTFIFTCTEKNAPACNNACFDFYCREGPGTAKNPLRRETSLKAIAMNRANSGCSVGKRPKSVCGYPLFQKKFGFYPRKLKEPSCDEWPPASTVQQDYGAPNRHLNSLRCMEESENESRYAPHQSLKVFASRWLTFNGTEGGDELGEFYDEQRTGKTCSGEVENGDFFQIEFKFADDVPNIPYCRGRGMPGTCENDNFQFLLTAKAEEYGLLNSPYAYGKDNHYALRQSPNNQDKVDIKMCLLRLFREAKDGNTDYTMKAGLYTPTGGKPIPLGETPHSVRNPTIANPVVLSKEITKLDYDIIARPQDTGVSSNIQFQFSNVRWFDGDKVITNQGGKNADLWCFIRNQKVEPNLFTTECVFPCTGV